MQKKANKISIDIKQKRAYNKSEHIPKGRTSNSWRGDCLKYKYKKDYVRDKRKIEEADRLIYIR